MSAAALLRDATHRLAEAGVPDPGRDARRLLAHALGVDPGRLTLHLSDVMSPEAARDYTAYVARRARREPVSQITGSRMFYGRRFRVTAATLDPRPESETLIEAALAEPFERVLDLGTGTGCLLLTLLAEATGTTGQGVDVSPAALAVARANAEALGLSDRAAMIEGDWLAPVDGAFDLIVSNPPYIAHHEMAGLEPEVRDWEPALALTDGADGLGAYRAILSAAPSHLVPGGRLLLEIGPEQGDEVAAMALAAGLDDVSIVPDMDGRDRVVAARDGRSLPF
ncbi:peptide chain release factor N(5)-glutamine methyltransferase [Wenxinia saemankumensis]|uniref:Release factor glutamine methyltransferase n=1 Tax=Wenxinia saemankumensis TaxID=1447782 RepID=A0A1M6A838_9RHOB|nr:peptide chain release factor N(5)-glutamine methyltransferase [Wenxinia saemankumensis]SHI32625.1 [protein release factor]-glutamine N5-methyltransferase [Wenxinia saemankumensis]